MADQSQAEAPQAAAQQQPEQQQQEQQPSQKAETKQPETHQQPRVPPTSNGSIDDRLKWWEEYLAPAAVPQIFTDFPRGTAEDTVYASVERATTSDGLRPVLDERMDEMDEILLASFAVFIHKMTHEETFVVAYVTSAGNAVPVRLTISPDMPIADTVAHAREMMTAALKHEVPHKMLLEYFDAKGPDALRRFRNLFKLNLAYTAEGLALLEYRNLFKPSLTMRVVPPVPIERWQGFALHTACPVPRSINIEYPAAIYSDASLNSMILRLSVYLRNVASGNTHQIRFLTTVTASCHSVLPHPTNSLSDSWEGSVFSHLERHARDTPDRPLIVHGDIVYTYKHINDLSNRVANFLVSNGVKKENSVAVFAHRSSPLVVAMMGVLKAGAMLCIIDPAYRQARQAFMMQRCDCKAVITLKGIGGLHPAIPNFIETKLEVRCQLHNLTLDEDMPELADCSTASCGVEVGPRDMATVSFTSGSTGNPKGVVGFHISLTHFYPWMGEEFGLSEADRFSMLSGIAHDPIQRDVFTPIFFGATIYIPDADDIMNPGSLAKWVASNEVTVMHLTPAMGQVLMAGTSTTMPSVRNVFFVGDILTKRDALRLHRLAANTTVINMYGTTETQRAVSFLPLKSWSSFEQQKEIISAGWGMKDVQLLVLNEHRQLCGVGVLGEVYVRSPHVSLGYIGLPEENRKKYLRNPYTKAEDDIMYRTGDLARYLGTGCVEVVGRADDQIKIRGFRIELGEIDTHLSRHSSVRENKTLVMRDRNEEKQVISFFVPMEHDNYDIPSIREHLKEHLPSYAVPSVLYPLKAMPLTPNGKIDKARLPFPDAAVIMLNRTGSTMEEEMNDTERIIHDTFAEFLEGPIGLEDNFFEIGGHSVLATRVTFALRKALSEELPINVLYKYPSIRKLAEAVAGAWESGEQMPSHSRENYEVLDLEAETQLDERVDGTGKPVKDGPYLRVLLTGATGFLGAFLLRDLLQRNPDRLVTCLVRASSTDGAKERCVKALKAYGLYDDRLVRNLDAIPGDLAQEWLGMTENGFYELADNIDAIIHNGAMVHWVYPYSKLKAPNVKGTSEILRLSCSGDSVRPVVFVSSSSVFDSPTYLQMHAVKEDAQLIAGDELTTGYAQSKWVAEKLIEKARTRGLAATVFRPGYIVGDSNTGVMNLDDYIVRLLTGCVQLGAFPPLANKINMAPVDFVAACVANIGLLPASFGHNFHFWTPMPTSLSTVMIMMRNHGFNLDSVPYRRWCNMLYERASKEDNALFPLLHYVLDDLPTRSQPAVLRCDNLNTALKGSILDVQSLELLQPELAALLPKYLAFLVAIGQLPRPDAPVDLPELRLPDTVVATHRADTHATDE